MENLILSSSPLHEPHENWTTPKRARVRQMRHDGKSWSEIQKSTSVPRSSARTICKDESSRTTCKGKIYQPKIITVREIRRIICYIGSSYSTRCLTFTQVRAHLGIPASARTIRRELRKSGYRRCIACPRPFISRAQAKKCLGFAYSHRWWGTSNYAATRVVGGDWRKVIWLDECTFELGKSGRIWITRRVDEKWCTDCLWLVYRSGRVSVMIWGAIG